MLITLETPEVQLYYAAVQRINLEHFAGTSYVPRDVWSIAQGPRYIRIAHGGAHSFIDRLGGDVLKPASFAKPAKHARGNIFDADGGLKGMGPYGPAYLR